MARTFCLKPMRVEFLLMIMAGFVAATAHAQPPRPTFDVSQHPELYFNVWPADVNEDGITDLVAGTRASGGADPGDVVIAIGRGDGTFLDSVTVDRRALPLTAADFNADGFVDIIVLRGQALEILGGHGDGTFDPPRAIDENRQFTDLRAWAMAADLNGDGHRDLIVPDYVGEFVLKLYPGTGVFTFGPPIVLATNASLLPADAVGGDFNGDGRRDFAIVNMCCQVNVFINQGGNTFTRSDISGVFTSGSFNDITAGDLNADGKLDLVAVSGSVESITGMDRRGRWSCCSETATAHFAPGSSTVAVSPVPRRLSSAISMATGRRTWPRVIVRSSKPPIGVSTSRTAFRFGRATAPADCWRPQSMRLPTSCRAISASDSTTARLTGAKLTS